MALCCCMLCAATVHAKSLQKVYLKDGGIIECQKYWKEDGRVMVQVNRDVLVVLAPDEVNIKRTFLKKPAKAAKRAKAAEKAAPVGKVEPAAGPQTPAPSAKAPAEAGKAGALPAPKPSAQPPGATNQVPGQKPALPPSPQKTAAPSPGPANQAPGPKPALPPSPQHTAAPSPGAASPAPGPKPAAPPAPAAAAKPVPQRDVPSAARSPLQGPVTSVRKTLPQVAVKPATVPVAMPGMGTLLLVLLMVLFLIISLWRIFTKAGEAGWQCLIPLWNMFVLVKISGKPWWWFLLLFVPVVNLIVYILVFITLAARFNKGVLFGLGLSFLGFIFFPILAFDSSTYE
jgi:hypothetical protein